MNKEIKEQLNKAVIKKQGQVFIDGKTAYEVISDIVENLATSIGFHSEKEKGGNAR